MATLSQIITEAYRESNVIAIGQIPNANELSEGLLLLNRFIDSLFDNEAGDGLTEINIGLNNVTYDSSAYYDLVNQNDRVPTKNCRLIFNNTGPQTVNLSATPEDGERTAFHDASSNFSTYPVEVKGNGRLIGSATSVTLNVDGQVVEYFYRADLNRWQQLTDLTFTDELPFPRKFEDMFILGLAMRVNPRNGIAMGGESVAAYRRLRSQFRAKYSQTCQVPVEASLLETSYSGLINTNYPSRDRNTSRIFSTGRYN